MKKFRVIGVLLATAVLSGLALNYFLKKAGLEQSFNFDLFEEDNEEHI